MRDSLRAIVVEDDFLLAEILVDVLINLGCKVLGSAWNVVDGVRLAGESRCDFAIVDLDLNGRTAIPVLDRLRDRGIPFLVATGAFAEDIPASYVDAARLSKPYDLRELKHALGLLVPGFELLRQSEGHSINSSAACRGLSGLHGRSRSRPNG